MNAEVPRLIRTVRHLTARQVAFRLLTELRYRLYELVPAAAAVQARAAVRLRADALATIRGWLDTKYADPPGAASLAMATDVARGRFRFVGRSEELGSPPLRWRPAGVSRLWQYHLHYFDYLVPLVRAARAQEEPTLADRGWALVDDWLRANPPGSRPGWEPYPTSIRLVNWAAAWALAPASLDALPRGAAHLATALASQAAFLDRHLEHHLGGNHLIKNARALILAGLVFDGTETVRWYRNGLALLRDEVRRQILSDGGHYERSPLYHAAVLEDLLDCLEFIARRGVEASGLEELRAVVLPMARWLKLMTHPDGGLALFNDTVALPEPSVAALLTYGSRVVGPLEGLEDGGETTSLAASGFYVIRSGESRAVVDCGEIGPRELPAHAHADLLSYELTWSGERIVVDSGVPEYQMSPLRSYVRSTSAHNTLVIDEQDQAELWASHRVGRRPHPLGARLERIPGAIRFVGAHDGYARLGVIHHRHVLAFRSAWIFVDEVLGRGGHAYTSYVHLHPHVSVEAVGGRLRVKRDVGPSLWIIPIGPMRADVIGGWYCPAWGVAERNAVVRLHLEAEAPVALGYAIAPDGFDLDVAVRQHGSGVSVTGSASGTRFHLESERLTVRAQSGPSAPRPRTAGRVRLVP